jgi:WD40 repeat protein
MGLSGTVVMRRIWVSSVSGFWRIIRLILGSSGRPVSGYDAFISYSHLADDALAATLQAGLETFATPWSRSRSLRVFRDTTNLTATPGLLTEIIGALSVSRWFVLVASERAASSRWVGEEVSWWLENKDHKRFLIALSDGEISWVGADFDWNRTTALPPVMAGAFIEEPCWIDLREVKEALAKGDSSASARPRRRLSRYQARHQVGDWVAALAAPIRGVAKDDLTGDHLRYRKRTRRMVQAVLAVMLTLIIATSAAAAVAAGQLAAARLQARIATSREVAALSGNLLGKHLDLAELFAVEAYRLDPSPQALAALFQADTASPHLVTYLPAGAQVSAIAGSANGRVIVAGRSDGTVLRWSLPDTHSTVIARMSSAVTSVSVDDSGTAAVALSRAAALRWSPDIGARPLPVPAGQRPIAVSISASGRFAALASVVHLDDINNESELTLYGQLTDKVSTVIVRSITVGTQSLSFAGDSQLVTLDDVYGSVHRLSVPALKLLGSSSGLFGNVDVVALSPGGGFVSSSNGTSPIPVWEVNAGSISPIGRPWNVPTRGADPVGLAINAPGTLVAQAADGSVYVSGVARHGESAAPLTLAGNSLINPGALAFAGSSELISASGDLLTLWNLDQYSRIATETDITAPFACAACSGPSVAVQPAGDRVAVLAGDANTVTAAALPSGGEPRVARSGLYSFGLPVWTQNGRQLLVPTEDGGAQIWTAAREFVESGQWSSSLSVQSALGYSPDSGTPVLPEATLLCPGGRQVIEILSTGTVLVRNAVTGKVDELIKGPPSMVDFGSVDPNLAAVDASGRVAAVSTPHGVLVTSILTKHSHTVPGSLNSRIAYDGEQLLIQQPGGTLQIWNAEATRLIRVVAGIAGAVAGPVVGQDGLAVETGSDGSAAVIDLKSGLALGSFHPPAGTWAYSTGIGMSASGNSLITVTEGSFSGGKGELTDWQMSLGAWLKVACASAGHALTDAEWQEYIGGPPPAQLACAGTQT